MSSPESLPAGEQDPQAQEGEGEKWLKLLGEEGLIGTPIPYYAEDGRQLKAEEFPVLCYGAVKPIFSHIEKLRADDPRRQELIEASQAVLHNMIDSPPKAP